MTTIKFEPAVDADLSVPTFTRGANKAGYSTKTVYAPTFSNLPNKVEVTSLEPLSRDVMLNRIATGAYLAPVI